MQPELQRYINMPYGTIFIKVFIFVIKLLCYNTHWILSLADLCMLPTPPIPPKRPEHDHLSVPMPGAGVALPGPSSAGETAGDPRV